MPTVCGECGRRFAASRSTVVHCTCGAVVEIGNTASTGTRPVLIPRDVANSRYAVCRTNRCGHFGPYDCSDKNTRTGCQLWKACSTWECIYHGNPCPAEPPMWGDG